MITKPRTMRSFNTQPPEGGWSRKNASRFARIYVSTHSRLKAAGFLKPDKLNVFWFQHTAA